MSPARTPGEIPDQEREHMLAQVESSIKGMISLYRRVVSVYGELNEPRNAQRLEALVNSLTVGLIVRLHNFDRATMEEMGISIIEAFYREVFKANPAVAGAIIVRITAKLAMLRAQAVDKQLENVPDPLMAQGIEELRRVFGCDLQDAADEQKPREDGKRPQEDGKRPQFIKTIKVGEAMTRTAVIEHLMQYHSASDAAIFEAFPALGNVRCVLVEFRGSVDGANPVLMMVGSDSKGSVISSSLIDPYTGNPRNRTC